MGIPLWKAVEVTLIWLVAVLFAVPEALAFDMLEIPYRGKKLRVCLLHPEQTTSFMKVIPLPTDDESVRDKAMRKSRRIKSTDSYEATVKHQFEGTDRIDLRRTLFDSF